MTNMRDHSFYTVTLDVDRRDRLEDSMGELTGYSEPQRRSVEYHIVAPSQLIAEAWALARNERDNPKVVSCVGVRIDGFVQDHIW